MPQAWRGAKYDDTHLLLLGESAYSWMEDGKVVHPSATHAIDLVEDALENFPTNRFINMLSRAITREDYPSKEQLRSAWERVAFTNYVEGGVGMSSRIRPAPEMWRAAKAAFPALINELRPRNIIVLGKMLWGEVPEADIYLTDDVQRYRVSDDQVAMCWAVQHPAAGLSWKRLADVIDFACERKIRP